MPLAVPLFGGTAPSHLSFGDSATGLVNSHLFLNVPLFLIADLLTKHIRSLQVPRGVFGRYKRYEASFGEPVAIWFLFYTRDVILIPANGQRSRKTRKRRPVSPCDGE